MKCIVSILRSQNQKSILQVSKFYVLLIVLNTFRSIIGSQDLFLNSKMVSKVLEEEGQKLKEESNEEDDKTYDEKSAKFEQLDNRSDLQKDVFKEQLVAGKLRVKETENRLSLFKFRILKDVQ